MDNCLNSDHLIGIRAKTAAEEVNRAFNRYREIDLGMKQDLVKILENKRG